MLFRSPSYPIYFSILFKFFVYILYVTLLFVYILYVTLLFVYILYVTLLCDIAERWQSQSTIITCPKMI